jgi:2-amino-4-hydroxy-6-hydroxymethyldihydropteridine diphosphokinase
MLREDQTVWQCGTHEISLARPRVMGVLNVTPDSFSDGGKNLDHKTAVERGLDMLDQGADIIDVGGESTRPGFEPVDVDEEAKRVVPVVRDLVAAGAIVSVDTRHPEVARMCVRLGASIVNDVTAFTNPDMVNVAADTRCGCVVMHAGEVPGHANRRVVTLDSAPRGPRGGSAIGKDDVTGSGRAGAGGKDAKDKADEPVELTQAEKDALAADASVPKSDALAQTMSRVSRTAVAPTVRLVGGGRRFTLPESAPIMRQLMGFLGDQARTLMRAGVAHDRICIDPGAGFGKYADEDVVIQRATAKMVSMGYPVMCAVSRKRFVGAVSGVTDPVARDAATLGVVIAAIEAGARVMRVHDIATTVQALDSYWAMSHPDPRRAFVSIGSNVGDRLSYLSRARALIDAIPLTCVVATSHAYETDPAYGIATPVANCVVEIKTELAPLVLLDALLDVENQLGRKRFKGQEGHGPRTCDCDLMWMEGETHAGRKLVLPHPGLGERDYVIVPMEDLMHDPVRFLTHAGVAVAEQPDRVGRVRKELGEIDA